MLLAIGILIGLIVGGGAVAVTIGTLGKSRLGAAEQQRRLMVEDATREAETLRREAQVSAREEAVRLRAEIDQEVADHRSRIVKVEERALAKEEEIDAKLTELVRREQGLSDRETHLRQLQEEQKHAREQQLAELERISGMTVNEAKLTLLERSEDLVRHELARRVRQLEEEARTEAKRRPRNLVADALQRVAGSHAAETTVSVIELPSDDMKGRIIGRDGRNIRALEHLTGVDVIIDETPSAVMLSSFDGIRREIARITLERLIADGRIHPALIEETYEQAKGQIDERITEEGERAMLESRVHGLDPELVRLLGKLKFRTSYGQNVLDHLIECSELAGLIAAELGASVDTARRAALLHDIGKAVSHEIEGPHALVGARIAQRHGEPEAVTHAMEAHHNEVEPRTVEAVIVQIADSLSGARPGARGDSLEEYVERLRELEEIASRSDGVERVYAMRAGRAIRVLVAPGKVDDERAALICHEIASTIQRELEYPGQVKITVIRESRATSYAS